MKATAPDEEAAPPVTRRRVPALVLGLGGAAAAVVYASLVEKMRLGPPLVMVGLGGLTLVLAALALWRTIDPLARAELPAAAAPRAPARVRELERELQLVLKAIKEVELDYQMRKIAEPDYREMDTRYRGRAMRLMAELNAGDSYKELIERELKDRLAALRGRDEAGAPAAAAPPEAAPGVRSPACAGCGATNDEDARFCKKCGAKLG